MATSVIAAIRHERDRINSQHERDRTRQKTTTSVVRKTIKFICSNCVAGNSYANDWHLCLERRKVGKAYSKYVIDRHRATYYDLERETGYV